MRRATEAYGKWRAEADWNLESQEIVHRQGCGTFELDSRSKQWFVGYGGS